MRQNYNYYSKTWKSDLKKLLMLLIVFCWNMSFSVEVKSQTINLHGDWKFKADNEKEGDKNGYNKSDFNDADWKTIKVPGRWGEQGYPDCTFGWYRKKFTIAKKPDGKTVMLKGKGLADAANIYLNGKLIHRTTNWEEEFSEKITDGIKYGEENVLAISLFNMFRRDNMYCGGIRGSMAIEQEKTEEQDEIEEVKITNDEIRSGKYPDSYKVKRKDKSIPFFAEMIADAGRITNNYCPTRIEDLDLYLKDMSKAVSGVWYDFRCSDPLLLEKHYPSMLSESNKASPVVDWYSFMTSTAFKDVYIPYSDFDKYPDKANKILSRIQNSIDTIHKNGLEVEFEFVAEGQLPPINLCGCTVPGAQPEDLMKHPEYQPQVFNPTTGEFITLENYLDWTNEEALGYMLKHLENTLKKIKDIDYCKIGHEARFGWYRRGGVDDNDNSEVMKKYKEKLKGCTGNGWNSIPAFSESGLKNYRKYLNDPNALFPSKTGSVKTDRTFITDNPEDWKKWKDWIEHVYADFLHRYAEAATKANKNNPRFKGNLLLLHSEMVHEEANPEKILASPYITGWEVELMTSRMNRPVDFNDVLKIKKAAKKYNKIFGLWIYATPFNWYTFDTSRDVKWVRQWYLNNQFETFVDFGAEFMSICHVLNLNPLATPGNKLYRGKNGNSYDESSREIISILHKKFGRREKLSKEEEEIYNRAQRLPKVYERERVAQILPVKENIELDGDLKEWDKSKPLEVYARSIVNGVVFDRTTTEKYEAGEKEFNKNPIKTYYHYDKGGVYIGIEGPSKCLEPVIEVRMNLENPDNKSDKWIRSCNSTWIAIQNGKLKGNINGHAKIAKGGNGCAEFYIPYKALPLGDEFEAKAGKVISLGLTFRPGPVIVSEGGIPEILRGDIGMEELWGYGILK